MKKVIYLLVIFALVSSCKKDEPGNINCTISYINSTTQSKSINNDLKSQQRGSSDDSLYTQFGDYVTSLTPRTLTAKFRDISFHNDKPIGTSGNVSNGGYKLTLVDINIADDAPERYADFTNNNSINVVPGLGGNLDHDHCFAADEIHFIYLCVLYEYLYQEVELPMQYDNVDLFWGMDSLNSNCYVSNHVLKTRSNNLTQGYNIPGIGTPNIIIFGNTDSTYMSATGGNNPIWGNQGAAFMSNKYSTLIFYKPQSAEDFHITTELSFDSKNLIQIYAGSDNIPYTMDDVFVYAPKFWDRFSVIVITN